MIDDERGDALAADHEGNGVGRTDLREDERKARDDHEAEEPAEIERPGCASGEEGRLRAHRRPQSDGADQDDHGVDDERRAKSGRFREARIGCGLHGRRPRRPPAPRTRSSSSWRLPPESREQVLLMSISAACRSPNEIWTVLV